MKTTIPGRVRNTRLPKTKPLLPLFEAVINSFQAVTESRNPESAIDIRVEREHELVDTKTEPISGFVITDTGDGFTDANWESFDTVDSELKKAQGGKGLGRFIWLVAFDRVLIDSNYRDRDGFLKRRSFEFDDRREDIAPPTITKSDIQASKTTVRLEGFREPYRSECPKHLEVIAQQLIGHFLRLFLDRDGPAIAISDRYEQIDLRRYYADHYDSSASQHSFAISDSTFTVKGFFLKGNIADRHEMIFAADSREVTSERLSPVLGLPQRLQDDKGNRITYLAFVEGSLLNAQVDSSRTAFAIPGESDDSTEVTLSRIRESAMSAVKADLRPYLDQINQTKRDAVAKFIAEEAPYYRWVARDLEQFIDQMPADPTRTQIEDALHKEQYRRERELHDESRRILSETVINPRSYYDELRKFAEQYNELGVSALAQYVLHRRIILQLLEKAVSQSPDDGSYSTESVVHNLVFPMRNTSDEIPPDRQNLWIIDERLDYHSFLTSDLQLKQMKILESRSQDRPDIFICNHPLAFTDGSEPVTSLVLIEFKRPDRDNYKEDPLEQVYRLLDEVRSGQFKDRRGMFIRSQGDFPAYCYVICDLTKPVVKKLENYGALPTYDGQGYFGYNSTKTVYFEVISYTKLLSDAMKRNRALFHKLGLSA